MKEFRKGYKAKLLIAAVSIFLLSTATVYPSAVLEQGLRLPIGRQETFNREKGINKLEIIKSMLSYIQNMQRLNLEERSKKKAGATKVKNNGEDILQTIMGIYVEADLKDVLPILSRRLNDCKKYIKDNNQEKYDHDIKFIEDIIDALENPFGEEEITAEAFLKNEVIKDIIKKSDNNLTKEEASKAINTLSPVQLKAAIDKCLLDFNRLILFLKDNIDKLKGSIPESPKMLNGIATDKIKGLIRDVASMSFSDAEKKRILSAFKEISERFQAQGYTLTLSIRPSGIFIYCKDTDLYLYVDNDKQLNDIGREIRSLKKVILENLKGTIIHKCGNAIAWLDGFFNLSSEALKPYAQNPEVAAVTKHIVGYFLNIKEVGQMGKDINNSKVVNIEDIKSFLSALQNMIVTFPEFMDQFEKLDTKSMEDEDKERVNKLIKNGKEKSFGIEAFIKVINDDPDDITEILKSFEEGWIKNVLKEYYTGDLLHRPLKFEKLFEYEGLVILGMVDDSFQNAANAAERAKEAVGKMTVRTSIDTINGKPFARVDFKDKGPGIAKSDMKHIFEKGFTKRESGKGGMGLALAIQYMKLKGGGIKVLSNTKGDDTIWVLEFDDSLTIPKDPRPARKDEISNFIKIKESGTIFSYWIPLREEKDTIDIEGMMKKISEDSRTGI